MPESITLTREQLYDLVWRRPMLRLAEEYSISNVGLGKVCKRHGIPTPSRGYWALLEAGRAPTKPRLPTATAGTEIRLFRRDPLATQSGENAGGGSADEKPLAVRIVVADRLTSLCELVQQARTALQAAKEDETGFIVPPAGCLAIRVSKGQLSRSLRIADALLKTFREYHWEVSASGRDTVVDVDSAPITLSISEGIETEERPVKPSLESRYSFHYDRHETVRKPSGKLSVSIREQHHLWHCTQRRNWNESDDRPIERSLSSVVTGMIKLAAVVKADLAQKERESREREERQRRVQAAVEEQQGLRAALAAERSRVDALRKHAQLWREARDLRHLIDEARRQRRLPGDQTSDDIEVWASWALAQADRLDPFVPSPPSILDDASRIEHLVEEAQRKR